MLICPHCFCPTSSIKESDIIDLAPIKNNGCLNLVYDHFTYSQSIIPVYGLNASYFICLESLRAILIYVYLKLFSINCQFRDGGSRTGAFLAILMTLSIFKATKTIDFVGTVQKLRSIRPQFIENMVMLHFIYQSILYIKSAVALGNFRWKLTPPKGENSK